METCTEAAQRETEGLLRRFLDDVVTPQLMRSKHARFLQSSISQLGSNVQGLHCSQPWLVYWTLQAADLLGCLQQLYRIVQPAVISQFVLMCFSSTAIEVEKGDGDDNPQFERRGGFGGGPGQLPHLASTYAAVSALCILSDEQSLHKIDRDALQNWFLSIRQVDGSFSMHEGGEADVRATYCVTVVTTLLHLGKDLVLPDICAQFVARCQTYEGGIACSLRSHEAHAGYTQCGLAALILLNKVHLLNIVNLRRWLAFRQLSWEGGFNGRTNKLVDSCYSHWAGASHVLLKIAEAWQLATSTSRTQRRQVSSEEVFLLNHAQLVDASALDVDSAALGEAEVTVNRQRKLIDDILADGMTLNCPTHSESAEVIEEEVPVLDEDVGPYYFNQRRLQRYVLSCCQNVSGGLMDKPDHPNDLYHTCYSLSGLSQAQSQLYPNLGDVRSTAGFYKAWSVLHPSQLPAAAVITPFEAKDASSAAVATLRTTNPIFNINRERVSFVLRFFGNRPFLMI